MPNGTNQLGNNFNMEKDKSMNKKIIIGTLMGCFFGATVGYSASVVSLPHTFAAGTPIKASEVNANFSALAQEISSIKGESGINKSSNFSEATITPISAVVGSNVTIGSKDFVIKQKAGIEDPITGKKYTVNYPESIHPTMGGLLYITSCKVLAGTKLIVKAGVGSGFTSYVTYDGKDSGGISGGSMQVYIQLSPNICLLPSSGNEFTVSSFSNAATSLVIDSAIELQKYISVQEL